MGGLNNNYNTPTRNRKVGMPDPQGNNGQSASAGGSSIAKTEPSQMVRDMAAQNYALNNGGQMPPQNTGVQNNPVIRHPDGTPANPMQPMGVTPQNRVVGRFEAQRPVIRSGNGMVADGTSGYTPSSVTGQSQGNGVVDYPMGGDNQGGQPVVRHPDGRVAATPQPIQNGTPSVFGNPTDVKQNDYSSLSAALNAARSRQGSFKADPTQGDGGFFGWIKGLMPKSRPGKRAGETDDEYDARRTRNMQMMTTFADAIRHIGNIVNTSKGAPVQVFNDPNALLEAGRKERKTQRQKQAALDAEAAKNQANLTLKQQAAEADRKYKEWLMGLKDDAAQLGKDKFQYRKDKDKAAAEAKAKKDDRDFKYKQERDKKKDELAEARLAVAKYNATHKGSGRSGRGGSGSGGKYWFEDKNGKMKYQPNKTMWEQEYYREYGELPKGESTVSTSTKTIDYKTGQETTTTTRRKGASVTSQAATSQNAAKAARNAKGKSSGGKPKNGYKNTKALGL